MIIKNKNTLKHMNKNREKYRIYLKLWRAKNVEKCKKYYKNACKDKKKMYIKNLNYRILHREEINAKKRQKYKNNPENSYYKKYNALMKMGHQLGNLNIKELEKTPLILKKVFAMQRLMKLIRIAIRKIQKGDYKYIYENYNVRNG